MVFLAVRSLWMGREVGPGSACLLTPLWRGGLALRLALARSQSHGTAGIKRRCRNTRPAASCGPFKAIPPGRGRRVPLVQEDEQQAGSQ
jgi:hypothetical protein